MDFVLVDVKKRAELAALAASVLPAVMDHDDSETLAGPITLEWKRVAWATTAKAAELAAMIVDRSWQVETLRAKAQSNETVRQAHEATGYQTDGDRTGGPGARAS